MFLYFPCKNLISMHFLTLVDNELCVRKDKLHIFKRNVTSFSVVCHFDLIQKLKYQISNNNIAMSKQSLHFSRDPIAI